MKARDKIEIGYKIVRARLFNVRIPLVVSWSITNKCNLNCRYCARRNTKSGELTTEQAFSVIDQLRGSGTKILSFTGGEPLLREDIGKIIDYAHSKQIYVNINTNGTLFMDRINELANVSSARFSLDGRKEINDFIRGQGVFDKVIKGVKMAKESGISVSIVSVLSKYNLDYVGELIELVNDLGVGVIFQPMTLTLLCSETANSHLPDKEQYRELIKWLLERKKSKNPILNTKEELLYLKNWPDNKNIFCYAANISCRIETGGNLYHCGRRQDKEKALNCLTDGVRKAFDKLIPVTCSYCWCALRLRANYIASLDPKKVFSLIRSIN